MPKVSNFENRRPKLGKGLDNPIKLPREPSRGSFLLGESEEHKAWLKECQKIKLDKIPPKLARLLEIYKNKGVDVNNPWAVVIRMAHDYVPAFDIQVKKQKGKQSNWTDKDLACLWYNINEEYKKLSGQKSIETACKKLIKSGLYEGETAKNLENIYHKAKKSILVKYLIWAEEKTKEDVRYTDFYLELFERIIHN